MSTPNLHVSEETVRRHLFSFVHKMISEEIQRLYEPRMITPDHTAEFIEAMITMTDSRQVLELGMYTGYTTLHMIRAVIGKPDAKVVAVDSVASHDREFFKRFEAIFEFIEQRTPESLYRMKDEGRMFDLVYVDSAHGVAHTILELSPLWSITRPGSVFLFHDCPLHSPDVYHWLESKVGEGLFKGAVFPTAPQPDVTEQFGPDNKLNRPNLGVFIRP